MIPKVIHFCWLSNDPYPPKIKRCIDTWHKVLPDYEIINWNFDRLGDTCPDWVHEAFANKMYAFAADWVRAYVLFNFGGIYLDSDVEIIKSFDDLLHFPYLLCRESGGWSVEAAVMGAEKGMPLFQKVLQHYDGRHFIREDGSFDTLTMPEIFTDIISRNFTLKAIRTPDEILKDTGAVCVLPEEYFSPLHTVTLRLNQTPNTYAIHHFAGSWLPRSWHWKKAVQRFLGAGMTSRIQKAKKFLSRKS